MEWEDDPQDRAPMTEAIDTIADLRRQLADVEANEEFLTCKVNELTEALENAKLSEGYALQTVANLHKEVAELRAEIERLRKAAIEWVQAPCTSPTCRGLKNGSPFMVTCEKGRENQAVCNECFCK